MTLIDFVIGMLRTQNEQWCCEMAAVLVLVYLVTICRYAHGDAYKEKTKSIIIRRWRKRTRKQVAKTAKMQWGGQSEKVDKYL